MWALQKLRRTERTSRTGLFRGTAPLDWAGKGVLGGSVALYVKEGVEFNKLESLGRGKTPRPIVRKRPKD